METILTFIVALTALIAQLAGLAATLYHLLRVKAKVTDVQHVVKKNGLCVYPRQPPVTELSSGQPPVAGEVQGQQPPGQRPCG